MAIYVSAGHHLKDPGAIANGLQENQLTIRVRDRVIYFLKELGAKVFQDVDKETLNEYLARIKPGSGSVVCEFHFDAASPAATGTTVFYADNASDLSKNMAFDLAEDGAEKMGIKNRGAKSEKDSHRGKLGLLHTKAGIAALVEVGFITNSGDIDAFEKNFDELCKAYAHTLYFYDQLKD